MRTIGLLGGMRWESTVPYYRTVNEVVKARLGGLHSAKVVLVSVDCVVLCTNTMHKVADAIEAAVGIPLRHIADPTAAAIGAAGVRTVGLLGTRFTMEQDFYVGRLEGRHGLTVLTPPAEDRALVHRVIYEELVLGRVLEPSRAAYRRVIEDLVARGAEGVILGCTEISMRPPRPANWTFLATDSINSRAA